MATPIPLSSLSQLDRNLLRVAGHIVPQAEREEWNRAWQAELWHMRQRSRNARRAAADLSSGLICDALWLRTDSWRRILSGTAALCVASLFGLLLISTLLALALNGDWHSISINLAGQFQRFLFEAPLIVFVNIAITPRIYIGRCFKDNTSRWLLRRLFLATKIALTLLLAFLLSADACRPMHALSPIFWDLLQTVLFTLLALVGLRWAFHDQDRRCKQCLRLLALPARIGRPTHNLLEWSGTELVCKRGHGLLSVPEMETSWCQSSQWVHHEPAWKQPASI